MPEIVIQLPDVDIDSFDEGALLNHFVAFAKPALQKAVQECFEQQKPPAVSKSSFAVSFDEFTKLSVNEQRKLRHQALHENRNWIDYQLAERNAEWVLVLGGIVERSSTNLDELPSKQEIYQFAEQKGFAPYVFVKDALVEEHSASRWALIERDDYYPTVTIFVVAGNCADEQIFECGKQLDADFDTGSPVIFLDLTIVEDIGIDVSRHIEISSVHLRRAYDYIISKVKIGVKTKQGDIKSSIFTIRAVVDWKNSPFCFVNPQRAALVGRNILLKLQLKTLLDGECKTTEILE
ncbi:hypothetical protein H8E77_36225 [bacterium]|nr:hypothetical protein [bacterium]